jgi:hypothetical protein
MGSAAARIAPVTRRVYTVIMRSAEAVDLPPDPVIEAYKKDIDRTLLRENLKLTPTQRLQKLMSFLASVEVLRRARPRTR